MLTDPLQEDIFKEEEFEIIHYRKTLLPRWMKVLAGIGAVAGMILLTFILIGVFTEARSEELRNEENSLVIASIILVVCFFLAVFITGTIALIQLIREKKWAIYGSFLAVLSHMLIIVASLPYTGFTSDKPGEFMQAVIFYSFVFISQLVFFIRLIMIFKRWLAYSPSSGQVKKTGD